MPNFKKNDARLEKCRRRYLKLSNIFRKRTAESHLIRKDFLNLFSNIKLGIFIVDLNGKFVFFNKEAGRITGHSPEEILGTHFRVLLSLDDLGDGFQLFYNATKGNYPENVLFRIRRKDRSTSILEFQVAPFYLKGRMEGAIAFLRDLTEGKKIEEANRKRVATFIRFNHEIEDWQRKTISLKKEVNSLLSRLGCPPKYSESIPTEED